MRHPLRKAFWWFLAAAIGALAVTFELVVQGGTFGDVWPAVIAGLGLLAIPVGLVWGCMSLLAAHGEARLRRGVGRIAHWEVPAAEWEAFRRLDTARAAEGEGLLSDYAPRPAAGRSVEVFFGRRQVIVDDYYCPLRRFAVPELSWVNWLQRPGYSECLEFGLMTASKSRVVRTALRVPVPAAAREAGVQVFHHFSAAAPKSQEGLAFRRPWLVIGSALGVAAAGLLVAGMAWLLQRAGQDGDTMTIVMVCGVATAIGACVFAALLFVIVQPWRGHE